MSPQLTDLIDKILGLNQAPKIDPITQAVQLHQMLQNQPIRDDSGNFYGNTNNPINAQQPYGPLPYMPQNEYHIGQGFRGTPENMPVVPNWADNPVPGKTMGGNNYLVPMNPQTPDQPKGRLT